ncbi:putative Ras-like protein Rab-18 [Paramicrosporidium saccamoebae]|uniref:Putative Ras-like protein Rab-18 n=1 Tax=Paramicrosporidium saccamoebae TaxID=1246581 RepID=A0A2H9TNV0_9FUNG|nr:putative Ras-like protein Rab-18 [Paramicrosporidium saccamoebae]
MADREFMRKMLDEIMGPERNKLPDQSGDFGVKFNDPNVRQLGNIALLYRCASITWWGSYHEDKLKDQFLAVGERYREEYERDFMDFLERLVNDLERKLRRGKDRLDVKPNDPTAALNPANDEFEEKRTLLDLQVKELLSKMEAAGEDGRIQEAQELMMELEKYKAELERLRQIEAENPSYRLEKRMEVCPTCGAFLIVGDAQKRIEAHFEGRQHNGWARVRETLADLKRKVSSGGFSRRAASPQREPGEIGEEPTERYASGSDHRRRGSGGDRDRGRDYGGRDRDRDRDRDRERDRLHGLALIGQGHSIAKRPQAFYSMDKASPPTFKLLLMGDSGVGKSSILLRFVEDRFLGEDIHAATIGTIAVQLTVGVDFKVKFMELEGERVKLTVWDTAGQERFRTLTSSYYRGAHGVVLVYDVCSRESFDGLRQVWMKELQTYAIPEEMILMIVANKIDKVRVGELSALYMECSAKTKVGIVAAFEELVHTIMHSPRLAAVRKESEQNTRRLQDGVTEGDVGGCAC